MTAREKIESLTNTWYGFAVFSALGSLGGFGLWSIATTAVWLLFAWGVIYFLGRRLVNKSSLTRTLLIVVSALLAVGGSLSVVRTTWSFITSWELSLLGTLLYSGVSAWMNIKSFRTLTDASVKAYFD
jgi:hypothetical protein